MRFKCFVVMLLAVMMAGAAFGQEDRGRINGLVTDPPRAVIPKAAVTLLNEGTKVTRSTVSDSSGQYVFEFVIPGSTRSQRRALISSSLSQPMVGWK